MLKRKLSYEAVVWALQATNRYCRWLGNRIPSARNRCRFEIQKMKMTTKSQIEILLPEPKPNKVQMLIVTTSAQLLAIPMLAVVFLLCPSLYSVELGLMQRGLLKNLRLVLLKTFDLGLHYQIRFLLC